jgi:hypothetical protein
MMAYGVVKKILLTYRRFARPRNIILTMPKGMREEKVSEHEARTSPIEDRTIREYSAFSPPYVARASSSGPKTQCCGNKRRGLVLAISSSLFLEIVEG